MFRQVLVPIADGCEEIEATTVIDLLRRAGAEVTVASCMPNGALDIHTSHGMIFTADCPIESCIQTTYHLIAIPGGMPNAEQLRDCQYLTKLLLAQQSAGRWYAAICAAPAIVLSHHGLLDNVRATCYPALMDKLEGAMPQPGQLVVVDQAKQVITAQGPGNAMSFTFRLIDALFGKDSYRPIAKQLIADWAL